MPLRNYVTLELKQYGILKLLYTWEDWWKVASQNNSSMTSSSTITATTIVIITATLGKRHTFRIGHK